MKTILKGYKYRLYPNDEQKIQLAKTFGCCRFVYNQLLAKKIDLYKNDKKSLSKYNCNNYCNRELKKQYPWLKEVDKFALTNSIYELDKAYQKFFKEHVGFPKFKSKHDHNYSYMTNFTNDNIKVLFGENLVQLPKLGKVECKLHRQFNGKIKFATVSQNPSGKYYVSFNVECEHEELSKNNNVYAFDLGLKEFLIDNNNNHIQRPKALYKYEEKLAKLQRQFAHKQKGSKNWNKQRIKIARVYEKITNIRTDFSQKLSSQIVKENQIIISEDLQISNMVKNHCLAKSIEDVSWGEFMRELQYKAEWNDRIYYKVSPWYASSQTCSECGAVNKAVKVLSVREWACPQCGTIHQRDENAAQNILKQGLKEMELDQAV